jgi:hypothetical protein
MDFMVNSEELAALSGLSHIQQLAYLRGIRPYMDVKTGLVGIKRRISHQSIAEQLYVEPHQGTKSQSYSRTQVRRALYGLTRAGVISIQSEGVHLILKCNFASRHHFVQNKADINPTQKADTNPTEKNLENTGLSGVELRQADIGKPQKADTPLYNNNLYIYLLAQFEQFWSLYPEKKSRERAFEHFKQINPDESLLRVMLHSLNQQIQAHKAKKSHGQWVPPWKYPANWLAQKCWEDEVTPELTQEKGHATRCSNTKNTSHDPFWNPESGDEKHSGDDEYEHANIINLHSYRKQ